MRARAGARTVDIGGNGRQRLGVPPIYMRYIYMQPPIIIRHHWQGIRRSIAAYISHGNGRHLYIMRGLVSHYPIIIARLLCDMLR